MSRRARTAASVGALAESSEAAEPALAPVVERLTATYGEEVPPEAVVRCVDAARSAVELFGEDPDTMVGVVERIADEDLKVITTGQESLARLKPMNRRSSSEA